jgi:hypothetical protein
MSIFPMLGLFGLALVAGGLFSAGYLAWLSDQARGHDHEEPH